jgi:hypothetical protein
VGIEPKEFVRDPLRDAKASIRGYVYQVDMSILGWLTLGEGEILELECGEDIDIIQGEIAKGRSRILEQIKVSTNRMPWLDLRASLILESRWQKGIRRWQSELSPNRDEMVTVQPEAQCGACLS